jgi:choline dehydrogenase
VSHGAAEFDVVVVGAGSAGCAVAGRLSEDPSLRVLLLEAGGSDDVLEVQVPAALYKVFRTRRDWNYTTEPQPGLDGRRLFWPRGKLLGGSSSINAMIYIRGAAADYDEWAQLTGDDSWSFEHVLPLFRRMEDNARGADRWHGVGGPLRVEDLRSPHPWTKAVIESAVAAGHPRLPAPRRVAAQPDRAHRRPDHPGAGRERPGDRRRVPLRRVGARGPGHP